MCQPRCWPSCGIRSRKAVDLGLTTLNWHVGRRIRQDILKERRADYGEQIVSALSAQLEAEFGRGFGKQNLFA
jgi:hypothetical protein